MDLTGQTFGRLTVIGHATRDKYYSCRCVCGNATEVRRDHLRGGKTLSCGCLRNEKSRERTARLHELNARHGKSGTRTHSIWMGMLQRCTNPNNPAWSAYGGRGISVCDRWQTFENFLADMGEAPLEMTIERIENDRHYEPGNCKWATRKEQMNNRRCNRLLEANGQLLTVAQWADKTGLPYSTIHERLKRGASATEAVDPTNKRYNKLTHCKRGHALTPDNLYVSGNYRACKACVRLMAKERLKRRQ